MEPVVIGVIAVAVAASALALYNKYHSKAEADVRLLDQKYLGVKAKVEDAVKADVKKVDEKANDIHDAVKDAEKKVEDCGKEAIDKIEGKKPGGDTLVGGGTGGGGNPGH